jgi:hypothetical protein
MANGPRTGAAIKINDYVVLIVGVLLILTPLAFDLYAPQRFVDVQLFLRLIASLGGGLAGAAIPGFINLDFPWVRAGGAAAFVVLFYSTNPPAVFNAHQAEQQIAHTQMGSHFEISNDTDRPGFNLPTAVATTDEEACKVACLSNESCKGFVIRKAGQPAEGCFLKSSIDPNVVHDLCCTTGIREVLQRRTDQ